MRVFRGIRKRIDKGKFPMYVGKVNVIRTLIRVGKIENTERNFLPNKGFLL